MEKYKEDLTSLKEELNSRIDAVIAKIEKPKFEVGDYWEHSTGEICLIFGFKDVHGGTIKCKHISSDSKEFAYHGICTMKRKLTPKEVEEALTKEAIKLGIKEGVTLSIPFKEWVDVLKCNKIGNEPEYRWNGKEFFCCGILVMRDGTWATPIKTKTIEEIAMDLTYLTTVDKIKYLTENKQTIIETINNL